MIKVYVSTITPVYELKDANCITIGRRAHPDSDLSMDYISKKEYFKKCFLAEHSTIEVLQFRIVDDNARADVINQIVRSTKGHPRFQVQSSRPDWNNGEQRKPSNETWRYFSSYWNPLSFMQMCRQRLCIKAMKESREWVAAVLDAMKSSGNPMLEALAECCVPQCEYRGKKCFELNPCGKY